MPLIDCPECRGMLSTKARACPHCGYPTRKGGWSRGLFATIAQLPCFVVGLLMLMVGLVIGFILLDVYYFHGLIPKLFGLVRDPRGPSF